MTDKTNVEKPDLKKESADLVNSLKEFALTVGEDCPEGHRRDPGSGACLPMGSTDYTAFTRSVNVDDGDQWRGLKDKGSEAPEGKEEALTDAEDMDEPQSCAEGTVFSFIRRECISLDEAEWEDTDLQAMVSDTEYWEEEEEIEDAAAPGSGGHREITLMQPEGRRDTVNHECPPGKIFDYKLRECIPLNKDTIMSSDLSEEFKKATAAYARLAMTGPDPMDGHRHVATLDEEGNGTTSMSGYGEYNHVHAVKKFMVMDKESGDRTSRHPGFAVPEEHRVEKMDDYGDAPEPSCSGEEEEVSSKITTTKRKGLPASSFGVPGKRKFPLDTCARVRNAMSRFNQAKGLTSSEKATLRRKIMARASTCGIEVRKFGKSTTDVEFAEVLRDMLVEQRVLTQYAAEETSAGPCPPGMLWDVAAKRCGRAKGFYELVKAQANHSDIIALDPEGRKDTPGFQCPEGQFFNFAKRECQPLDPSQKKGTTTSKASEEEAQSKKLTPQPKGRPARLPQNCPKGTIWDGDLQKCKPLDSRKKTKSEDEEAAMPDFIKKMMDKKKGKPDTKDKKTKSEDEDAAMPDFIKKMMDKKKGKPGKPDMKDKKDKKAKSEDEDAAMPDFIKKMMDKKKGKPDGKDKKKGKSEDESASDKKPGNREGLVTAPAGKLNLPSDCPPNTLWDAKLKVCKELDTMEKVSPGNEKIDPKQHSSIESMSLAKIIQSLDEIIKRELANGRREKSRVAAKELPNEAFPPSLVGSTRRSLMHHTPDVTDAYAHAAVDVSRLRNSLARVAKLEGYSVKAVEDAQDHLLYHAREIVKETLAKS